MIYLAYYIISGVISFCVLYTLYVILFSIKEKYEHRQDEVPWLGKAIFYTLFFIGYAGDVLWNILFGTALFAQLPLADKDQTLTKRLNNIIRHTPYAGWRSRLARFICIYMLNPHDAGHCGEKS